MKKQRSTFSVIFCIFFLLLFIVLPPLFRTLIPKKVIKNTPQKKIKVLKCTKTEKTDMISATASAKYINNEIASIKIDFEKLQIPPENVEEKQKTLKQEFEKLNGVSIIEKTINNNVTSFIINKEVIDGSDNSILNNYYQDIDSLKTFYEQNEYSCMVLES